MKNPNPAILLVGLCVTALCQAQSDGPSAREAPALAMEGYWISVVTEDWKFRMVTPNPGEYEGIPLNAAARNVADAWDAATADACGIYGAANLMRVPTRLRIGWEDDDTLRIETDAGRQTRSLHFGAATVAGSVPPSLQGYSVAEWRYAVGEAPDDATENHGSLSVHTSRLAPGLLRANGVPYSAETTMTEYFNVFDAPNADQWLVVTTIVEDPVYLTRPLYTSSHFKRLRSDSGWNPRACL
jgi:hypothetical protein